MWKITKKPKKMKNQQIKIFVYFGNEHRYTDFTESTTKEDDHENHGK